MMPTESFRCSTTMVRINSISDTGCRARQPVKARADRYAKRNKDAGYGHRAAVEGFAVLEAFGEAMQAGNIMREILIIVLVCNRFVATLI
ncbi:hypothetical protein CENSYa_1043 [Cenarchaeum symbiosum A]|uniref:Uncharacterized protein n=1 Tax=Cenarchaeum symbiosum (strain A) TaxID=414004 RepID=A0RWF7_CENSY|nr:hypothetical protein CENSYa_1043 [Cenarchaeum symbiosum A]